MLGALFYPKGTVEKPTSFESLYIPYIYKEIYLEGIYMDIFNTRENMVCIDIGANIGIVTQYMRDFSKVVYAIEPATEHYEALVKNIEFNKWTNVVPIHAAIMDKDGRMKLNLDSANRTCHSFVFEGGPERTKSEMVRTMTFETLFKEQKIDKVDFVKFDVEGAEESILMGESFAKVADKISAMIVEFHFPTFPKIVEHMIKLGFKARRYDSSAIVCLFSK